jgi:LAGLIDADG endonuclease
MAYLSERLKQVKAYDATNPLRYRDPPGLEPDWLPYLAGFLTADAHFGIGKLGGDRLRPRMRINARADDIALLAELARRTEVGRIYSYPRKTYEASPIANWSVFSAEELRALVELLDKCPPRGKKAREYALWREAVLQLEPRRPADQTRLRAIAERLKAVRVYPTR